MTITIVIKGEYPDIYHDDEYSSYEISDGYFRVQITGYRDVYYSMSSIVKIIITRGEAK